MRSAVASVVLLTVVAASCATAEPTAIPIEASKETCEEVVVERLPAGLSVADRTLVPYSRVLLGVETEYEGPTGFVTVISGGYLDDHLEPYDDLAPIAERTVLGRSASVLAGSFIDQVVLAAIWEEPSLAIPCDTRAVVAIGMDPVQFHEILDRLGTRHPGRTS